MPIFGAVLGFIAGLWIGGFIGGIINLLMPLGLLVLVFPIAIGLYAAWLGFKMLPI